ncbi:hypothetical protein C1H46_036665 [Malus baccata]|uniref:RING-type E3 ubiquitin transferase n=1 Tax=Malus baccata TaxID=106549 RepID=A0A540KU59_MALBA|nr:hypothetical protein C1H46_036665 [Malus baccata]
MTAGHFDPTTYIKTEGPNVRLSRPFIGTTAIAQRRRGCEQIRRRRYRSFSEGLHLSSPSDYPPDAFVRRDKGRQAPRFACRQLHFQFGPPPVPANYNDEVSKKISFQFQCVTWKLEKALGDIRYDQFDISEEVEEQVELVRAQLRRAIERYGSSMKGRTVLFHSLSQSLVESGNVENNATTIGSIPKSFSADSADDIVIRKSETLRAADSADDIHVDDHDDIKKPDANSSAIPDDFICPISLELMRDPVIVATGQTYERSYIQRWVDCGNTTCPKTQQKLVNLTLTPNYVLRSLIAQWCINNNIEQLNGKIKKSDGSLRNITGDTATIQALVRKLSSRSIEERRAAAAEIRSLSKRSTDNRILIAEAGAIPVLVNLLTSEDGLTQENAVTSVLNLSIYVNNKGLIMLAGAVPSIVRVIIIGASGEILALVELLQNGSTRAKKDASTALFNLCSYQGNKGRVCPRNKENAAAVVLALCKRGKESLACIIRLGGMMPLTELARSGTVRAKRKATSLLEHLQKVQQL